LNVSHYNCYIYFCDKLFSFVVRYYNMEVPNPIINKVAQKAIITLDLADFFAGEDSIVAIDLRDYLFKGLILRESDFREQVKQTDWSAYQDKYVVIHSSVDAIVPVWAYMVLAAELSPYAKDIANVSPDHAADVFMYRAIEKIDAADYRGQRVVIKGCGDRKIDSAAFVYITNKLACTARAIMYGEPCSMVPVYKKLM
jgi:hypothetical protein